MSFEEITSFFLLWLMKPRPQNSPEQEGVLSPSSTPFAIAWDKQSTPNGATYTCQWKARADIPIGRYTCFHCPTTRVTYQLSFLTVSWGERFPPTKVNISSAWWSLTRHWAQPKLSATCGPKPFKPINLPNTHIIFFQDIWYIRV